MSLAQSTPVVGDDTDGAVSWSDRSMAAIVEVRDVARLDDAIRDLLGGRP